jgi:hypothetical protein
MPTQVVPTRRGPLRVGYRGPVTLLRAADIGFALVALSCGARSELRDEAPVEEPVPMLLCAPPVGFGSFAECEGPCNAWGDAWVRASGQSASVLCWFVPPKNTGSPQEPAVCVAASACLGSQGCFCGLGPACGPGQHCIQGSEGSTCQPPPLACSNEP